MTFEAFDPQSNIINFEKRRWLFDW